MKCINHLLRRTAGATAGMLFALALGAIGAQAQQRGNANANGTAITQRAPGRDIDDDLARAHDAVRALMPEAASGARTPGVGATLRIEVQPGTQRSTPERRAKNQSQLRQHLNAVRDGHAAARSEFDAAGSELQRKRLPALIQARHAEAQRQFEQRAVEFERLMQAWQGNATNANLTALDDFLTRHQARSVRAPFDAAKLPWGKPRPTNREPAATKGAWHRNLWLHERVRTAQATNVGPITFQVPPEPGHTPVPIGR